VWSRWNVGESDQAPGTLLMRLILFSLFLAACGPPPTFITQYDPYYLNSTDIKWTAEQAKAQELYLVRNLMSLGYDYNEVVKNLTKASVYVYDHPVDCPGSSPSNLCNGLEYGAMLMVRDMGCPYNSAVSHEQAHWLRGQIKGDADFYHLDTALWTIADSSDKRCP
jgi:hypothetical protein